jgi:hypothetical protein
LPYCHNGCIRHCQTLPSRAVSGDRATRQEGRGKIQNDARTTLLQALAALLVLSGAGIGASVTLRQIRIAREGLEHSREQARQSDDRARRRSC